MSIKKRLAAFAIFLGVFMASYLIGTMYKMGNDESTNFLNDLQSTTSGIGALGIFFHNSSVSLPMFIPGVGFAWGAFTGWQTGAAFAAVVSDNADLANISPLTLFANPFGILELVAYSIAMSQSFLLVLTIVKRYSIKKELLPSVIEVGIVLGLLLVAGFIEYNKINPA